MYTFEYSDVLKKSHKNVTFIPVTPFKGRCYPEVTNGKFFYPQKQNLSDSDNLNSSVHGCRDCMGDVLESWIRSTSRFCSLYVRDPKYWVAFALDWNLLQDSARIWVERKVFKDSRTFPQTIDWNVFCNLIKVKFVPGFIDQVAESIKITAKNLSLPYSSTRDMAACAISLLILSNAKKAPGDSSPSYSDDNVIDILSHLEIDPQKSPNGKIPEKLSKIWAGKGNADPNSDIYDPFELKTELLYLHPISHEAIEYYQVLNPETKTKFISI